MKRPAVFFDRDNTLIANDGYLGDPAGVILIAGAADAIARVRSLGFATVVVSNQSGVARGMFNEAAVRDVDARMAGLLATDNPQAIVDRHEFCPFHPHAPVEQYRQDSPLRKPRPGMLISAAEAMDLVLAESWLIGDAPRDIVAGKAAGCRTILFADPALPASPAGAANGDVSPDFVVSSLAAAVDVIEQHTSTAASHPPSAPVTPAPATLTKAATLTAVLSARKVGVPLRTAPAPAPIPATPNATSMLVTKIPPVQPTPPPAAPAPTPAPSSTIEASSPPAPSPTPAKLESLAEQILLELRRRGEMGHEDFSVSKLLAGILQIAVLAVLLLGYLQGRGNVAWLQIYMLLALTLQVMTISLLIMSRMK